MRSIDQVCFAENEKVGYFAASAYRLDYSEKAFLEYSKHFKCLSLELVMV